jgi:hypothetical protein
MNNEKQSKVIHNILQHLDGRAGKREKGEDSPLLFY